MKKYFDDYKKSVKKVTKYFINAKPSELLNVLKYDIKAFHFIQHGTSIHLHFLECLIHKQFHIRSPIIIIQEGFYQRTGVRISYDTPGQNYEKNSVIEQSKEFLDLHFLQDIPCFDEKCLYMNAYTR